MVYSLTLKVLPLQRLYKLKCIVERMLGFMIENKYRQAIYASLLSGLIGGLFLTFLLKFIQLFTNLKVYTLLLNVDYIPYINGFNFSEPIEVVFHLIVSIGLSFFLYLGIIKLKLHQKRDIILFCMVICLFIGLSLYPTTTFSNRTPSLTSLPSISYWLGSHVLYGYCVGLILQRYFRKNLRVQTSNFK